MLRDKTYIKTTRLDYVIRKFINNTINTDNKASLKSALCQTSLHIEPNGRYIADHILKYIFILGSFFQVLLFFTRGQFWPSGIVVAYVCVSARPSVCAVITCLSAR